MGTLAGAWFSFSVAATNQAFANVGHDVATAAVVGAATSQAAIGMQQLLAIGFQPL